ncbi:MAG TPA: hypothetical protein VHO90_15530 [Bacteroidales bacterium]|nr:hypothetical protein [Bacteroidales bacterium]
MSNFISFTATQEDVDGIMGFLNQAEAKMTFNVNLTKEQLEDIPKMSDGRLPFTQKALGYGKQKPKIVAAVNDITEFEKDLNFHSKYEVVENKIIALLGLISSARAAAGSDAYTTALNIYAAAQRAAKQGEPGAQAIVDDLKKTFEGQGNKKKKQS